MRRLVDGGQHGLLVLEVRGDFLTLRPRRTRRGGPLEVAVAWGALYVRAMWTQAGQRRPRRKGGRRV